RSESTSSRISRRNSRAAVRWARSPASTESGSAAGSGSGPVPLAEGMGHHLYGVGSRHKGQEPSSPPVVSHLVIGGGPQTPYPLRIVNRRGGGGLPLPVETRDGLFQRAQEPVRRVLPVQGHLVLLHDVAVDPVPHGPPQRLRQHVGVEF